MKQINIYEFHELNEAAQKKAHEEWLSKHFDVNDLSDVEELGGLLDCLKKYGIHVKNQSLDDYSYFFTFDCGDFITGYNALKTALHFYDDLTLSPIINKFYKYRNKYLPNNRFMQVRNNCFSGYYLSDVFASALKDCIYSMRQYDKKDLESFGFGFYVNAALHELFRCVRDNIKYQMSFECFAENYAAYFDYFENGVIYEQK
nr:MAG TPA: hypothetical protein [Caudoviricetes sp.]